MNELHRSGLQTAQSYTQADPAQRHEANKESLHRHFQGISTDIVRESKLTRLQDT